MFGCCKDLVNLGLRTRARPSFLSTVANICNIRNGLQLFKAVKREFENKFCHLNTDVHEYALINFQLIIYATGFASNLTVFSHLSHQLFFQLPHHL